MATENKNARSSLKRRSCLAAVGVVALLLALIAWPGGAKRPLMTTSGESRASRTREQIAHGVNSNSGEQNPYPTSDCAGSDPTGLLLSAGTISNMVDTVPASADGGSPLSSLAFGPSEGPSSAAQIEEHWQASGVPTSELDAQGPYLSANPNSIVTYDEGITGFTDPAVEQSFYNENLPLEPGANPASGDYEAPDVNIDGQTEPVDMSVQQDVDSIPAPNIVVTTDLPGTDVGTRISVTIELGNTVVGVGFLGGIDLSWSDVVSYVNDAANTLESQCPGGEIVPTTSSSSTSTTTTEPSTTTTGLANRRASGRRTKDV